jgi:hypothetical protein
MQHFATLGSSYHSEKVPYGGYLVLHTSKLSLLSLHTKLARRPALSHNDATGARKKTLHGFGGANLQAGQVVVFSLRCGNANGQSVRPAIGVARSFFWPGRFHQHSQGASLDLSSCGNQPEKWEFAGLWFLVAFVHTSVTRANILRLDIKSTSSTCQLCLESLFICALQKHITCPSY